LDKIIHWARRYGEKDIEEILGGDFMLVFDAASR